MRKLALYLVAQATAVGIAVAQTEWGDRPSVPLWDDAVPARDPNAEKQHVFLSADGRELIVRFRPETFNRTPSDVLTIRAKIRNRVQPKVRAFVSSNSGQGYTYTYTVANRRTAQDPIYAFRLLFPASARLDPDNTRRWVGSAGNEGSISHELVLTIGKQRGRAAIWYPNPKRNGHRLQPGMFDDDIRVHSEFRPGITLAAASDSALDVVEWPKDDAIWPDTVVLEAQPILRWILRGPRVLTIGPMFGPDQTRADITRALKYSLEAAAKAGFGSATSRFAIAVREMLSSYGTGVQPILNARPVSEFDKQLARVLEINLNVANTVPPHPSGPDGR